MACGPDVIFIGGWLAGSYDALSQIAPVVYLATDSDLGVVESVRQNTRAIASLFGLEIISLALSLVLSVSLVACSLVMNHKNQLRSFHLQGHLPYHYYLCMKMKMWKLKQ